MTTPEELKAEIERLKRDNEALKKLKESQEADNAASVRKLQELQTAAATRVNGTEKQHPNEIVGVAYRTPYPQETDHGARQSAPFRCWPRVPMLVIGCLITNLAAVGVAVAGRGDVPWTPGDKKPVGYPGT